MAATRGIWLEMRGIRRQWQIAGLDATFKAEWGDANAPYSVLHHGEAWAGSPGPYCVFDIGEPIVLTHQTGHTSSEEIQTIEVPVQFRIHAKSTANEDAKDICVRLAMAIKSGFEPPVKLDVNPDSHVETIVEADFSTREGDDEWSLVVPFSFIIDAEYNL